MPRSPSKLATQETSSPLRSYSSVASASRPTPGPSSLPAPSSTSKSSTKVPATQSTSSNSSISKRRASRSNIPKPISTTAANSKVSLAPSSASSNNTLNSLPITPVNAAPSSSLDPSLVTAFVEPTSDALHAARARKASVSAKDGHRLTHRGSIQSNRSQPEVTHDISHSKRSSGEWRSRVRKQTGMDFTSTLEPNASSVGGSEREPQRDVSSKGMDSDEVEATSQITQLSQRGLKRSLSPLVPLATSFAEETIGTRARSASIQSSQYPFYQASNLSSLKVPRQLGHSSSVTDFSSSSYSARLQRVASEATLERLRLGKGDDHEDLDSSPPSTPSHGSFGDKTLNQGGSNRISLISRPRATTIASLGGTALPFNESTRRRARAGTLFSPIGSLSSQSLHSLTEGVSTSDLEQPSQGATSSYRTLLHADEATRRSRSGSNSTSSSYSQSCRDSLPRGSQEDSMDSSVGRSLLSPDTSTDSHLVHSWRRGSGEDGEESKEATRDYSSLIKLGRVRAMTSAQQQGETRYLPPALRNRTSTSTPDEDVFTLQLPDLAGRASQQGQATTRRSTISTADKPDRNYLSISGTSNQSNRGDGSSNASSGRSSRLDYHNEDTLESPPAIRFRSSTLSREPFLSLFGTAPSIRLPSGNVLRSESSSRLNLVSESDRSGGTTVRPSPSPTSKLNLPPCDLCGAKFKSLVTLLPCRHLACATCTSTGVSAAACPTRQHLCAACQCPVESIELKLPNRDQALDFTFLKSPTGTPSSQHLKDQSYRVRENPPTSGNSGMDSSAVFLELTGEPLKQAREEVVVVRMDNIPWELCYADVQKWVPEGTLPKGDLTSCPIHITIELMTGKTNNSCFIETVSLSAAQKLIRSRNNSPLLGRAVTLYTTTRREMLSDVLHEFLAKDPVELGPSKFGRREMNGIQTLLQSGGSLLKGTIKPLEFFTSVVGLLPEIEGGLTPEQGRVLFETTKDIFSLLQERVEDPGPLRDSIRRLVQTGIRSEALTSLQRLSLCAQGEDTFKQLLVTMEYKNRLFALLSSSESRDELTSPRFETQTPELAAQHRASYFSQPLSQSQSHSPVSPSTTLSSFGAQTPGAFGIQTFSPPMVTPQPQEQGYGYNSYPYQVMTSPAQGGSPRKLEYFYPAQPSSPTSSRFEPLSLGRSPYSPSLESSRGRGESAESVMAGNHSGLGLYQSMAMSPEQLRYPPNFSLQMSPPPPSYLGGSVQGGEGGGHSALLPAWNDSTWMNAGNHHYPGSPHPPAPFVPMTFSPSQIPMSYGGGFHYTQDVQAQGQRSHSHPQPDFNVMAAYSSNALTSSEGPFYDPLVNQQSRFHQQGQPQPHTQPEFSHLVGPKTTADLQSELQQINAMIYQLQQKKNSLGDLQSGVPQ